MNLLSKLQNIEDLTHSEQQIAQYIIHHTKQTMNMTINELAEETFSSKSSIIRLCQKLGYNGYADFKIRLAVDLNIFSLNQEQVSVDMPISPNATKDEIARTFLNLHTQSLMSVYNSVDMDALQVVADALEDADIVHIVGVGQSLIIAEDLHYKLRNIGIVSICNERIGFDAYRQSHKNLKQCVLIISNYANTRTIRNWIYEATQQNGYVILITANPDSPFLKLVHHVVLVNSDEKRVGKMGAFASRTAFSYYMDLIYTLCFMKHYNENVARLYDYDRFVKARNDHID